ncbi:sulfatase-like hydrolase/transferase [Lentisphaera marina]|uniref:sulfatase-like hydrolase/transferase n=1 Tax=Lentisphaera marina TaxID=1111041 RepID=UPI00236543AC|nr:sulfatase-like hydrolase/transferase [Lentisphaera marina]MDD7987443.1 sulfatase-like hydrolase/transferase [Lentisphaera marina]
MKKLFYVLILGFAPFAKAEKPNVIVILADDAGYADFGFMGSQEFKTPNLDQLAQGGVQFSNAYVTACMCAPSRAGLITGKYQQRLGFHLNLPHNYTHSFGLRTSQKTIANYMQEAGYKTAAFGKWHLGHERRFHPNQRGFDYFFGFAAGHRSFFPLEAEERKTPAYRLERNGKFINEPKDMYMTDLLTDDAISYIEQNRKKPFFIYLAYSAVHTPMHAKQEDLKFFDKIKDPNRQILAAMTKSMDDNIGRLQTSLKDLGLEKKTLIWFLNDNGGAYSNFSKNGILRGGKGGLSEGGLRVPTIISWPNKIKPGKNESPIISLDIGSSLMSLAGIENEKLDGQDILSPLLKDEKIAERDLFWASQEIFAMRRGNQKLIRIDYSSGPKFWLFDLAADPSESNNLAESAKDRVQELNAALNQWIATHEEAEFRKTDYLTDEQKNMRLREWMKF